MNIREFLKHKNSCPICNEDLKTAFFYRKKQIIKKHDSIISVFFDLNSLRRIGDKKFKVCFSINMDDNSFVVDFYDENLNKIENESPSFLIKRLKDMLNNMSENRIYKYCSCDNYMYSSNLFKIDLNNHNINDLFVSFESFHIKSNKEYFLCNKYDENKSYVYTDKSLKNVIKTGIIKFSNEKDMIEKLNKIILFS